MSEDNRRLDEHLKYLKLPFIREHYQGLAAQADEKQLPHIGYLEKLADGEAGFVATARSNDASDRPASRSSRPWISSTGAGPKK